MRMNPYLFIFTTVLSSVSANADKIDFNSAHFKGDENGFYVYGNISNQKWRIFHEGKFLFAQQMSGRSSEKTKIGSYSAMGGTLGAGYQLIQTSQPTGTVLPSIKGLVWVESAGGAFPRPPLSELFGKSLQETEFKHGMTEVVESIKSLTPSSQSGKENEKKSKTPEHPEAIGSPIIKSSHSSPGT